MAGRWGRASGEGLSIVGAVTMRADGDFAIGAEPDALRDRRSAVVELPWVWLRQVHGATVHVVTAGNAADTAGEDGDALVCAEAGVALSVQTADCAPIVLSSPEGVIGAAHAGWRGLEAGVVQATVTAMRRLGATEIRAQIGPCIHAEAYEFGTDELDRLAAVFGAEVRAVSASGAPALDLVAAARSACVAAGTARLDSIPFPLPASASAADRRTGRALCTAQSPDLWFSHRARGESERMATVVWRES